MGYIMPNPVYTHTHTHIYIYVQFLSKWFIGKFLNKLELIKYTLLDGFKHCYQILTIQLIICLHTIKCFQV